MDSTQVGLSTMDGSSVAQPPLTTIKQRSSAPKATDLKDLRYLHYQPQSEQEIVQLDTDEDKDGIIPIDHIVRKIREVYGKTPVDMQNLQIDWDKWGVSMNAKGRPSPYNFPAFERQVQDVKKYQPENDVSKGASRNTSETNRRFASTSNAFSSQMTLDMKTEDQGELQSSLKTEERGAGVQSSLKSDLMDD